MLHYIWFYSNLKNNEILVMFQLLESWSMCMVDPILICVKRDWLEASLRSKISLADF